MLLPTSFCFPLSLTRDHESQYLALSYSPTRIESLWQAGLFQSSDVEIGHARVVETDAPGRAKAGGGLRLQEFGDNRLSPVDPKGYFPMLGLAASHFFVGHFEETVALTGRILEDVPTHNAARRYRAAALAHLGRIEEAEAVVAELLKVQPNSSLRTSRSTGFHDPRMADLYITGLEKAGLPE